MENISLSENFITITDDTYLYFQVPIVASFDINIILINLDNDLSKYPELFQTYYSYSYDLIEYADFKLKPNFVLPDIITEDIPIYLSIYFKRIVINDLQKPLTLFQTNNVDSRKTMLCIKSIGIDAEIYLKEQLSDKTIVKYIYNKDLINRYPKWNFYDNQQITINRWLDQSEALSEIYGHTCIYFKTEPVESKINHTLANNNLRNVTSIKKFHIFFPNNELPVDKTVFSEWDQFLPDEVMVHVLKRKFELAFGINQLPSEKDYLYLPIINKMFRISTAQPAKGFMGKSGWWETYLTKYEDDSTVTINPELIASMESVDDFDISLESLNQLDDTLKSEIFAELELFKKDTLNTAELIAEQTIEPKKEITENFTNKLFDSNNYIGLKETEQFREFYSKRLKIVSINPSTATFPVTMYDNSSVPLKTVALQYKLFDFTIKNKFHLTTETKFETSFNAIFLNKFNGTIIDLLSDTIVLFSFNYTRQNKLQILDILKQQTFDIDYVFDLMEFYNVSIEYKLQLNDTETNQISIKIFKLSENNIEKNIVYQNIYTYVSEIFEYEITNIQLFGGNFYFNDLTFIIDNNQIFKDYVNPVMQLRNFY